MQDNEHLPLIQSHTSIGAQQFTEATLSWCHVSVKTRSPPLGISDRLRRVPAKPARVLIADVSGIARPGEILAIMGASGVGKTSLLRMLSGQDDPRTVINSGDVFIDGQRTRRTQRMSGNVVGLVEQHEVFIETMTTEEHLTFQAMLRMPRSVSDDDRRARVHEVVSLLSLDDCFKTKIERVSGGERKRIAFASVLLTDPSVILIDEPTSGLDSYLAKELMRKIRMMATEQCRTIVVVLHQPTSEMFSYMDSLCLIVRGGRLAYFGRKEQALTFFNDDCGMSASSLDEAIEQLAAPPNMNKKMAHLGSVVADHFAQSTRAQSTVDEIVESSRAKNECDSNISEAWQSSYARQFKWLIWRALVSGARDPTRAVPLIHRIIILSLLLSVVYHFVLRSTKDKHNVDALLFTMLLMTMSTGIYLIITLWIPLIPICIKDNNRSMYQPLPFYVVNLLIFIPLLISFSAISSTIIYFLAGISSQMTDFFLFIVTIVLVAVAAGSIGALLTLASKSYHFAINILSPLMIGMSISSGFYVSLQQIPALLRIIQYLSPLFYGYSILSRLVLQDNEVTNCSASMRNESMFTGNSSIHSYYWCLRINQNSQRWGFGSSLSYDVCALLFLIILFNVLAFIVLWYKTQRSRLYEQWYTLRKGRE